MGLAVDGECYNYLPFAYVGFNQGSSYLQTKFLFSNQLSQMQIQIEIHMQLFIEAAIFLLVSLHKV